MSENVQKLRDEINKLALCRLQAVYEIEGLLLNANTLMSLFSKYDWDELKNELPNWDNRALQILASALSSGDVHGNLIEDHFFYGYIFTLVDDSTSAFLLDDMFYFFNSSIDSAELLESIKSRLSTLKQNGYLTDNLYDYWLKEVNRQKAML